MGIFANVLDSRFFKHPLLRKYTALVNEDLTATYSRDIQKWLLVAPIIGVLAGLIITGIAVLVLDVIWAALLPYYLAHHWAIVVGLVAGFFVTGLIMQFCTPDPDEHSTEEIVRSYHEHQGDIDIGPFWWKLLAAITTVGSGGSAALEGPSIYSGGAIGSWLWTKLRRFGLEARDRRIMLISGAAAGMSAVFRAPLTGIVFALEMPYKDDLAHEALLPSLIASVVAYATLVSIVGAQPLFGFAGSTSFRATDIWWSALLGAGIGLIAIVFDITFRRVRVFSVTSRIPHWLKLTIGGLGTALCGLAFVTIYDGPLIPIGPNYEAVRYVLEASDSDRSAARVRRAEIARDDLHARLRRRQRDVRAVAAGGRRSWQRLRAIGSSLRRRTISTPQSGWRHSSRPDTKLRLPQSSSSRKPPAGIRTSSRASSAPRSRMQFRARRRSPAISICTRLPSSPICPG